jgi:TPR repeat protein
VAEVPDNPRFALQLAFVLLYPTSLYFPKQKEGPPDEAWTYLDKAAAQKYPGALFFKAHIVESGRFPGMKTAETALPLALALYREAAELGNPAAMVRLAREYSVAGGGKLRRGDTGSIESDMDTAMGWARKAIDAGHPRGEVIYANLVLTGGPVRDEDRADAIARLERRMGEGDCDAYWALGSYKFNKGDKQSMGGPVAANPEALRLLRTAAEGGHYAAQRMMAGFYGPDGVFEEDPVQSRYWLQKAKRSQVSGAATGKDCGWK